MYYFPSHRFLHLSRTNMALKEIMLSVDTRTREVDAGKQAK
jgi:hypothetical protein